MSSYIQLPYGVIRKSEKINLKTPKNYGTTQYISRLPYLYNASDPKVQNEAINLVNNRADLRKFLLATSDYGQSIQENINSVVTDGDYNNAALRHVLDKKD